MPKYVEVPSDEPLTDGAKVVDKSAPTHDPSDSFSALQIPTIKKGERVVSQREGETVPENPHHRIVSPTEEAIRTIGSGAGIVNQYGPSVVILTVFLGMMIWMVYVFRLDSLTRDETRRTDHRDEIKSVVTEFKESRGQDREDRQKQWQVVSEQVRAMNRCADTMEKSAAKMEKMTSEIQKLVSKIP